MRAFAKEGARQAVTEAALQDAYRENLDCISTALTALKMLMDVNADIRTQLKLPPNARARHVSYSRHCHVSTLFHPPHQPCHHGTRPAFTKRMATNQLRLQASY